MLVVCVNDVVFLEWLKIKSFFSKTLPELLVLIVDFEELLVDYLYIFWVFQVYLHIFIIIVILLVLLIILLALWGTSILVIIFIILVVNDVGETSNTSSFFVGNDY